MNDLEKYFYDNTGRVIHKWKHYFEIYERHFSRYRGRPVNVLEIGIYKGGSLRMWKEYFGRDATIYGIDIDPACSAFAEQGVNVLIGDQEDRDFLRSVRQRVPVVDVLIDDGGHRMRQQIVTFEELFGHVAPDGVYLCEDLHTSYWPEYGGGYLKPGSFIEYSKHFIDYINAWHVREAKHDSSPEARELRVSGFTQSVHSLHYYDSVLVIEKRPMSPPVDHMTGAGVGEKA